MSNIIIYGPRASGKTTQADLLANFYNKRVVDDWFGRDKHSNCVLLTDINHPNAIKLSNALKEIQKDRPNDLFLAKAIAHALAVENA